jgi:parallel beta-helix repeat protein
MKVEQSTNTLFYSGNTLYVGGGGPGNYSKIQDAIDNATFGDTVFVYDDSSPYYENIQIDKSINLIGENKDTTVICATSSEDVVTINSNNVSIHELTIKNASGGFKAGIKIGAYFDLCIISENIIKDNYLGVSLERSNENIIENNTFFNNKYAIFLTRSNDNLITENIIDHPSGVYNAHGISLTLSKENNISGNTIKDCDTGVYIFKSDNNIFLTNVISGGYRGICLVENSNNNSIIENNISYNEYGGIETEDDSSDNIIYHNNFIYNNYNANDKGDNIWDDGKYGNYWSDYEQKYPNAKKKPQEGIWDTPYEIPGGDNQDNCPLIKPWPKTKSKHNSDSRAVLISPLLRFLERYPLLNLLIQRLTT